MKQRKTVTRVLAVLLAVMLIAGLGTVAMAAPNVPPTPPVGATNTLIINHWVYQDDWTYGSVIAGQAPTPNIPPLPAGTTHTPVAGALWHVHPVTSAQLNNFGGPGVPFDWVNDDAADFLPAGTPAHSQTTNAQGVATFSNLPHGVYIFWWDYDDEQVWIITLPIWDPGYVCDDYPNCDEDPCDDCRDAGWLTTVNVWPKIGEPDIPGFDKLVNLAQGNRIVWEINMEIMSNLDTLLPIPLAHDIFDEWDFGAAPWDEVAMPAAPTPGTPPNGSHIRIVDLLDPRLSLNTNVGAGAISSTGIVVDFWCETADDWVVLDTAATPTQIVVTVTPITEGTITRQLVVVDILREGRDTIADTGEVGEDIRVRIDTILSTLDDDNLGSIDNEAHFVYGPVHEGGGDDEDEDLFGIRVEKYVTGTTQLLEGAIFHLYLAVIDEDDQSPTYGEWILGDLLVGPMDTTVGAGAANEWTIAAGVLHIYGLTEGHYFLREVSAPPGFVTITEPILILLDEDEVGIPQSDYMVLLRVPNSVNDGELPITGGAGTLLFTIVGLLMIGGSVLFLIVYRKKQTNR